MQLVAAREPEKSFFSLFWLFGRRRRASVMLAMDDNLAPSLPEGSGTFRMATWNIVDGRRGRLAQAAAGLAQMGVGLAVLTETKLVDDRHPKTASGYTIMCSKVVSGHQGGVAIMWKENDPKFEVESVLFNNGPNIVTFQVTTGDKQFYVIGIYAPPNCSKGVDDLRGAWEACPQGCKPIVFGDLTG